MWLLLRRRLFKRFLGLDFIEIQALAVSDVARFMLSNQKLLTFSLRAGNAMTHGAFSMKLYDEN